MTNKTSMKEENGDTWTITLQSDRCCYCMPVLKADDDYLCQHPKNDGKECAEGLCPVASEQAVEAESDRCCYCVPALKAESRCPKCGETEPVLKCEQCGHTFPRAALIEH
ncbi:MAG: hypothetical protein BBJ57_07235 [Desulfobacterales bacterium PC51MH44]|nr:MAG: hypothetical protein BBJ57_07235 [Desulfobacterales bacterium PC51MH44]